MRPQPLAIISGNAAFEAWNAAERLTAMTASQRSSGKSTIFATCWMPALLTRMSTPPNRSAVCANKSPDLGGLGHIGCDIGRPHPVLFGKPGAQPLDLGRIAKAVQHDVATFGRERGGDASPIPLVEPVTTAVLPFSIDLSTGIAMQRREPISPAAGRQCGPVSPRRRHAARRDRFGATSAPLALHRRPRRSNQTRCRQNAIR